MANDKDKDKEGFFPKYTQPSHVGIWGPLTPAADNKYALHVACAAQMGVGLLLLVYPRRSTFRPKFGKWPFRIVKTTGVLAGASLMAATVVFEYPRTKVYDPWAQRARVDRIKAVKEGKKVTWWWGAHDHKPVDGTQYLEDMRVVTEVNKRRQLKQKLDDVSEGGFKLLDPLYSDLIFTEMIKPTVLPRFITGETPISGVSAKVATSFFEKVLGHSQEEQVTANRKFRTGILEQTESPLFLAHRPWLFGSPSSIDAAIKEVLGDEANDPDNIEALYDEIATKWDGSIMWCLNARDTDVTIRLIPTTGVEGLAVEEEQ